MRRSGTARTRLGRAHRTLSLGLSVVGAALLLLAPPRAAAHPCEEEVTGLAGRVTSLENLVSTERDALRRAESGGRVDAAALETLRSRLRDDEGALKEAWQALLAAQERCGQAMSEETRQARRAAEARVAIDLKAAYAFPVGDVWGASNWNAVQPMTNAWTGAIPLEVAVRYRFDPNLSAGLSFGWGPAFVVSPGIAAFPSSSGSDMRVGLQLAYDIAPFSAVDPWFLIGTGWSWTGYSSPDASVTFSGWDYVNVQAGVAFRLSDVLSLGPYAGFVGGAYTNIVATGSMQGWGGAIPVDARGFHGWVQLGVKGTASF